MRAQQRRCTGQPEKKAMRKFETDPLPSIDLHMAVVISSYVVVIP